MSCVSGDDAGTKIRKSLEDLGVCTELLLKPTNATKPTGERTILVDSDGKRQILVTSGINDDLYQIIQQEKRLDKIIDKVKKSKILHLSSFVKDEGLDLQIEVLKKIR